MCGLVMMNWLLRIRAMKIFALVLILVFIFASCKTKAFLDSDGALTTKEITQNRDMTQYAQGGHFWCHTRFGGTFGNEKDKLEGEKKVRDFIWQHWTKKKRGYIKLSCPDTDVLRTTHYFVEPNQKGEWNILRRHIIRQSNDEILWNEIVIDWVERIENKENGDWSLVSKSSNGEIIERMPDY